GIISHKEMPYLNLFAKLNRLRSWYTTTKGVPAGSCRSIQRKSREFRFRPIVEELECRLTPSNFSGDPAQFVVVPEAPVLSRLDRFLPSATPSLSDWTTVSAADTNLDPTTNGGHSHLYVIAHGWAPGFEPMVEANGTPTDPLKWWQTLDT